MAPNNPGQLAAEMRDASSLDAATMPSTASAMLDAEWALFLELQTYIVCIFAVFVWDILVTIRLESQYVWPSKLSAVKVCFFVARYCTLCFMVFLLLCAFVESFGTHCSSIFRLQDYVPIFIFVCCNFKLAQRCASLFYSPRPIFYSLCGITLAQAIVQCLCSAKNIVIRPPEGLTGCFSSPGPGNQNYGFVYWILPLITHTIILLITIVKVIQYWRVHGRTDLLDVFLRDGIQYFAVVTSVNIVNVVYLRSKITIHGQAIPGGNFHAALALCVTAMSVCRLILHMRVALATHTTVTYMTEVDLKAPNIKPLRLPSFFRNLHLNVTDMPPPRFGATGTHTVFEVTPVVLQMSPIGKESIKSRGRVDSHGDDVGFTKADLDMEDLPCTSVHADEACSGKDGAPPLQRSTSYHSSQCDGSENGQHFPSPSLDSATNLPRVLGRSGSHPAHYQVRADSNAPPRLSGAANSSGDRSVPSNGLAVWVQTERVVRSDT